ncbi:RepB family plasmid replication initiator protein, partial [Staphylococcus aureus]|uniref:RepB family plasmid replication initiator protein n=1 Tax=Staphylococcus aureus TaxID=1280 RepID=UPI001C52A673
ISYVEGAGVLKLRFSPEIVPLITRLEQNFTSYELEQVKSLNVYATRLYELLVCWRSTGKTPIIEIEDFRSKIGISYVEGAGVLKLRFSPEIVPLITRLEQNFTSYE